MSSLLVRLLRVRDARQAKHRKHLGRLTAILKEYASRNTHLSRDLEFSFTPSPSSYHEVSGCRCLGVYGVSVCVFCSGWQHGRFSVVCQRGFLNTGEKRYLLLLLPLVCLSLRRPPPPPQLWVNLAERGTAALEWPEILGSSFSDHCLPGDEALGSQIVKDLHRTGHTGFSTEEEHAVLKRVLLAYARFNKTTGYCQGFNIMAALILKVVDFDEHSALKVSGVLSAYLWSQLPPWKCR